MSSQFAPLRRSPEQPSLRPAEAQQKPARKLRHNDARSIRSYSHPPIYSKLHTLPRCHYNCKAESQQVRRRGLPRSPYSSTRGKPSFRTLAEKKIKLEDKPLVYKYLHNKLIIPFLHPGGLARGNLLDSLQRNSNLVQRIASMQTLSHTTAHLGNYCSTRLTRIASHFSIIADIWRITDSGT